MSHSPTTPSSPIDSGNRGLAALSTIKTLDASPIQAYRAKSWTTRLPPISETRLAQSPAPSTPGAPFLSETQPAPSATHSSGNPPSTVLYLAYGSNLAAETFQGNRGIRPLAATNVVVPSLVMTFDLPGLPYSEPCFANTAFRIPPSPPSSQAPSSAPPPPLPPLQTHFPAREDENEKTPFLSRSDNYEKEISWPHGLVGVVYEVTPADYAHIIATEGGGASYTDITIPCHPLPHGTVRVPDHPTTTPFLAHTLFAPADPAPDALITSDKTSGSEVEVGTRGRLTRPDPHYAQPSPRYLSLIKTGAAEHAFPPDYTAYLHSLHPYLTTSTRQRLGRYIFLGIWGPIVAAVFTLAKVAGRGRGGEGDGKSPRWVVWLMGKVFESMWRFYDGGFKGVFGEGERTEEEKGKGTGGRV